MALGLTVAMEVGMVATDVSVTQIMAADAYQNVAAVTEQKAAETTTEVETEAVAEQQTQAVTESTAQKEVVATTQIQKQEAVTEARGVQTTAVEEPQVVTEEAEEAKADGAATPASDFEYTTNQSQRTVTITGYKGSASTVVIPSKIGDNTVTAISEGAFDGNNKLTAVTIPSTVTSVGSTNSWGIGAFQNCIALKSVTIQAGNKEAYIGYRAFYGCKSLKSITIPANYTTIHRSAFEDCVSLTTVNYQGSEKYEQNIYNNAFQGCKTLITVTLSTSLRTIGSSAFENCTFLQKIAIPEGVTSVASSAFASCKTLSSVSLPSTLTALGSENTWDGGVFANCIGLKTVTMKAGTKESYIGPNTFQGCKALTAITVPGNYKYIGNSAFDGCNSLKTMAYSPSVAKISHEIHKNAFINCKALTTITFGTGLTSIGESAFSGASALTNFTLPTTMKNIGISAFQDCDKLTSVTVPEGTESVGNSAFYKCDSLQTVSLPSTLKSLGSDSSWYSGAFEGCGSLKTVTIKAGKEEAFIGCKTFAGCVSLTAITIPGNYAEIYKEAFQGCKALKTMTYSGSDKYSHSIGDNAFSECSALTTVTFGAGLQSIGSSAFASTGITSLTIPEGVTTLNQGAFYNCDALKSVAIPSTVERIGSTSSWDTGVFENCDALEKVTMKTGKIEAMIGYETFKECNSLTSIVIPGNYNRIYNSAFSDCASLTAVTIQKGLFDYADQQIGNYAFSNCKNLKTVSVTSSLEKIGEYAFKGCGNLTNIRLQEGLTSIGHNAFENCTSLKSIILPATLTKVDYYAFSNCSALTDVLIAKGIEDCVISEGLFYNCSALKTISIPGNYTRIQRSAFEECKSLETVYWEEGGYSYNNQNIEYCAFKNTPALKKVVLAGTIAGISDRAFELDEQYVRDGFQIVSVKGSAAETFAVDNNFAFKAVTQPLAVVAKQSAVNTVTGDVVSIEANATGGTGNYMYRLVEYNETTKKWKEVESYQATGGFTWKATTGGVRQFYIDVRDGNGKIVRSGVLKNVNVEPLRSSLRTNTTKGDVGSAIKIVASAGGGEGGYTYQFVVFNIKNNKNEYVKDYSTASTINWTPQTAGDRRVYVRVKDKKGQIVKSSDIRVSVNEKVSVSAKMATVIGGVKVTGTGAGGNGKYQYKFVMYTPATKKWTLLQDYGISNTYTWKIAGTSARQIYVDVKDGNGKTARSSALSVGIGTLKPKASLTASATNVTAGTSVKFTAKASDGSGSYQYKFLLQNPTTGNFAVLKDYSTASTYTWKAAGSGKRNVYVDVKDSKGQVTRSTAVVVNTTAAVSKPTVKITASTSKATAGSKVTVKAAATGGSGSYQYRFLLKNPTTGNIVVLKNYSTVNSYTWTAAGSGARHLLVDVKDSNGTVTRSAACGVTVKAASAKLTAGIKASATTAKAGSKVTLTATATGGAGGYQYRFLLKNPTTGNWAELKSYSTSNKYVWTAGGSGARHVYVDIRDNKGTVIRSSAYGIKVTK